MAKIFLDSGDNIRVLDNANIIGKASTSETVRIMGTPSVTMDANIDRVEFTGNINQYTFEITGTSVIIRANGSAVATFGGLENIVTLAFADGSAPLELKGLDSALLGTISFLTSSGASTLNPSLNTSDKSTVGDYISTDDPTNPTTQSISIDQGTIDTTAVEFDASTGSFKYLEDPAKENNVEISSFSSDDTIQISNSEYSFISEGSDVVATLNNNGVVSMIRLIGIFQTDVVFSGDYQDFNSAVGFQAFIFA